MNIFTAVKYCCILPGHVCVVMKKEIKLMYRHMSEIQLIFGFPAQVRPNWSARCRVRLDILETAFFDLICMHKSGFFRPKTQFNLCHPSKDLLYTVFKRA